jgi:MFS family permease
VFGYASDRWSTKGSLLVSTVILFVFAALAAGSYGAGGSIQGMFAALTAYRFLVGVGIGGEVGVVTPLADPAWIPSIPLAMSVVPKRPAS